MKRLDRLLGESQKLVTKGSVGIALNMSLLFVLFSLFVGGVSAQASTVGEEFVADTSLQSGLIVSISPEDSDSITLASLQTGVNSIGVVNESTNNAITYAKDGGTVSVALSGEVYVYASNANGDISTGDSVGVSWIEGIGMKSFTNREHKLVGVALEDFNTDTATDYGTIETADGDKDVKIGFLRVRLFDNDEASNNVASSAQTTGIENFANSIAGKSVNPIRVLAGTLIFIVGIALAGFFSYSSIRASFISIGRNPMASPSIYKNLVQVSTICVVALVVGAALAYVVMVV